MDASFKICMQTDYICFIPENVPENETILIH